MSCGGATCAAAYAGIGGEPFEDAGMCTQHMPFGPFPQKQQQIGRIGQVRDQGTEPVPLHSGQTQPSPALAGMASWSVQLVQ